MQLHFRRPAVLRDSENMPFVYVEVFFAAVRDGARGSCYSLNGQTQVTSGLKPGDRVVGNGSLFLQFANSLQR